MKHQAAIVYVLKPNSSLLTNIPVCKFTSSLKGFEGEEAKFSAEWHAEEADIVGRFQQCSSCYPIASSSQGNALDFRGHAAEAAGAYQQHPGLLAGDHAEK